MTLEPREEHPPPPDGEETLSGGPGQRPPRKRLTVAAVAVAVVAAGGTVAYAASTGGPPGSENPPPATNAAPTTLGQPDQPGGPGRPGGPPGSGRWFGLGGAAHGETTVQDPDAKTWTIRVWQHGTVESTNGSTLTVKSADGTSWTWHGLRAPAPGNLSTGETVLVMGTRAADGTNTAEHLLASRPGQGRDGRAGHRRDCDRPPDRHDWGRPGGDADSLDSRSS
ncbi:hypothetical protein [Peterkaempfera bronchialis]|uniref:hypothetical protein n=1 Tax=Peterkaempfera bronchialis TaxID=2126346 RepID=UPI003C2ACDCA